MNWEAPGAIAERMGAIAVFASLAYLAVQIRQSNTVMREQAQYDMLQNQLSYFGRLAENPEIVRALYGLGATEDVVREWPHEAHVVSHLSRLCR